MERRLIDSRDGHGRPVLIPLGTFFVHFSTIHPTSRKRIAVTHRTLTPLRYDSPKICPIWRVCSSSLIWCRILFPPPASSANEWTLSFFSWISLELFSYALLHVHVAPAHFPVVVHNNFPTEETSNSPLMRSTPFSDKASA
jgi:hypothetical protein